MTQSDNTRSQNADKVSESKSLEAALLKERNPVKRFFKMLRPGLITGASDDECMMVDNDYVNVCCGRRVSPDVKFSFVTQPL